MAEDLTTVLGKLREKESLEIVKKRLDSGDDPLGILNDARRAMEIVGKRFEEETYFLPELIYAGEILKGIAGIVKPKVSTTTEVEKLGKIVIGTVAGDIHDIGKDIVTFMLDVNGFEVHDLGIDVPAQKFVDTIQEVTPEVVGLSGLLTLAFDSMKETIDAINAAGLRESVKIMIGGGQTDEHVKKYTGADVYCADAVAGVRQAQAWIGGK